MAALNIGDRVKWRWNEPGADPSELIGKIIDIEIIYTVRWDDGEIDRSIDPDDIEPETPLTK